MYRQYKKVWGNCSGLQLPDGEGLWPHWPSDFLPSKCFIIHLKQIQSLCRWKHYVPSETPAQTKYHFAVVNPKTTLEPDGGEHYLCAHCRRNCRARPKLSVIITDCALYWYIKMICERVGYPGGSLSVLLRWMLVESS